MQIIINIRKQHLYLISALFTILLTMIIVNAYRNPPDTTIRASILGHSVDEIDWRQEIPGNVSARDYISVGGQVILDERDDDTLVLGDLISGDGLSELILRAGDQDRVTILNNGNVGIGTAAPAEKLDVNGDIKTNGAILHHATGSSPGCSIGGMIIRKWSARTCEGNRFSPCTGNKPTSCTTPSSWSTDPRTCNYYQFDEFAPGQCATITCSTNTWSEVFCVGN